MTYLIFSDSHGTTWGIREAVKRQTEAPRGVFFLGDGVSDTEGIGLPVYAVHGNCDGYLSPGDTSPMEDTVTVDGVRVMLMHGHLHHVKSGVWEAATYAAEHGADILLFGHTHEAYEETFPADTFSGKPLCVFNPGSIAGGSFGVLTVRDGTYLLSHGTVS